MGARVLHGVRTARILHRPGRLHARLLEEEQAYIRVQEELRLAYDIQTNLLPEKPPEINGYDIAGRSIPAKVVGGDYFDFIPMDNNRLAFCLGDVSGKGMPAALLMANLQATVRGQILLNASTSDCLEHSNMLLFQNTSPDKFASFFLGILDTNSHQMFYSNAGHNYPLLFSKEKKLKRLESAGIVLGCLESFDFQAEQLTLSPGDLFLVYSDGIIEAFNAQEEEFGEERLNRIILENWNDPSEKLLENILQAVSKFTGDAPQTDDITLIIIKRNN
jgi:sigma-B regulation protein RsbU (phosphoserine phosphatase)